VELCGCDNREIMARSRRRPRPCSRDRDARSARLQGGHWRRHDPAHLPGRA